jgi:hypothetical protein
MLGHAAMCCWARELLRTGGGWHERCALRLLLLQLVFAGIARVAVRTAVEDHNLTMTRHMRMMVWHDEWPDMFEKSVDGSRQKSLGGIQLQNARIKLR